MKHLVSIIALVAASTLGLTAEAQLIKRLSGDTRLRLTAEQIEEIENTPSEQHPVEGYLCVQGVADCFDEMSYVYTGGRYKEKEIRFRLRSPNQIKPGKKYPLVISFHGLGESDDDNSRQLSHLQLTMELLAGPKSLDYFVLATQCPKDNRNWTTSLSMEDGKGDAPITYTMEIMDALIKEFPVDEDRISCFGFSSGGYGAWSFVMKAPERFAALVPSSTSPPMGPLITNMNVWVFACTGDAGVPIQTVRDKVRDTNAAGGSALLTELPSNSHDSWTEALKNQRVHAWMIQQKRNSYFNSPPGVYLAPRTWPKTMKDFGPQIACIALLMVVRIGFRTRKEMRHGT